MGKPKHGSEKGEWGDSCSCVLTTVLLPSHFPLSFNNLEPSCINGVSSFPYSAALRLFWQEKGVLAGGILEFVGLFQHLPGQEV